MNRTPPKSLERTRAGRISRQCGRAGQPASHCRSPDPVCGLNSILARSLGARAMVGGVSREIKFEVRLERTAFF